MCLAGSHVWAGLGDQVRVQVRASWVRRLGGVEEAPEPGWGQDGAGVPIGGAVRRRGCVGSAFR